MMVSCNPVVTSGEIYNAMTRNRGEYNIIKISADKNDVETKNLFIAPNIKAQDMVVPGTITQEMVDKWTDKYGWDSDFVRTKVRAMLPKQEADTLIPLDWIELAQCRELADGNHPTILGVDIARFGDDDTVIFPTRGRQALEPICIHGNDTMQVTGHIVRAIEDWNVREVYLDVIGIGSGVYDRLIELQRGENPPIKKGVSINAVNVGEKATAEDKFVNLRSEIWWAARESLDPKGEIPMALRRNDDLMAELAAPKYTVESGGKIKVESKDDMKARLGRSPDLADAYCLAVFKRYLMKRKPSVAAFGGAMPGGTQRTADWM
jgi:phage terminase large subunit